MIDDKDNPTPTGPGGVPPGMADAALEATIEGIKTLTQSGSEDLTEEQVRVGMKAQGYSEAEIDDYLRGVKASD